MYYIKHSDLVSLVDFKFKILLGNSHTEKVIFKVMTNLTIPIHKRKKFLKEKMLLTLQPEAVKTTVCDCVPFNFKKIKETL